MNTASVIRMPEPSERIKLAESYQGAYRAAEGSISFGEFVKAAGVVAAALMLVATIGFTQRAPEELLLGVFLATSAGLALYSLGAILSVQGYMLRASLESGANSSPAANSTGNTRATTPARSA
jgi:hypothetical protein